MESIADGRHCTGCGAWKPWAAFARQAGGKNGRRARCTTCKGADDHAYQVTHRAERRAREQRRRNADRAGYQATQRAYHATHAERMRDLKHQNYLANRDRWLVKQANRRARITGIPGRLTVEEWQALCERHGQRCVACGSSEPLSIDHVVPLSRGGPNTIANTQPLCVRCNQRKQARTIDFR